MLSHVTFITYFEHDLNLYHKVVAIFDDFHYNKREVKALSEVKWLSLVSMNFLGRRVKYPLNS